MKKDGKSLSFRKEDGTWYNAEDKSFPVDQDSLTTMTNALGAVSSYPKTGFTGRFVGIWSGFAGIDCAIYGSDGKRQNLPWVIPMMRPVGPI